LLKSSSSRPPTSSAPPGSARGKKRAAPEAEAVAAAAVGDGVGSGAGAGAAPERPVGLLAQARDADPARGEDGDLPLLLAAGPAGEAILRFVGTEGLGPLAATRRALARDVRELAAGVAWREGERVNRDGVSTIRVKSGRIAAWVARFPNARALAVGRRGMTPALAVSAATAAGGLRRLEALSLRRCGVGAEGAAALAAALTAASTAAPLLR